MADATEARTLIRRLNERYEKVGRAFRIEEVGGGFEMLTKPQFAPWLRRLGHVPQEERLTSAGMEVLAIIAYRQPVMRADIEAIRGVSSEEVLKQLLSRDLVRICGRSEELGRPYLYGTTKRFLKMFGLKSLEKLPRADWINETWDVEDPAGENSESDLESPTMSSTLPIRNNMASSESTEGLQELQDVVDNRISEDEQVNSVDLQPGTDTKESIVKLAHSAIGLAFESEENLEEQLAVASRLASIPVAVDEDEDEEFEDDDEEFEDEEDEDFEEFEDDEEDEDLDEDLEEEEEFEEEEEEEEADDDESFEDDEEWEEVDEEGEDEEEEEDEEWDDDEEEEEEEEDWE